MGAAAIPLAIFGAGALGAGASLYASNKASNEAKSAMAEQSASQARLESEITSRRANEESEANAINVRDAAKRRQAGLAIGAGGRQDTILTGPLGVTGEAPGGKKTLLGT